MTQELDNLGLSMEAASAAMKDMKEALETHEVLELNDNEELTTDFMMIAGFSEDDAIKAAANVRDYDNNF